MLGAALLLGAARDARCDESDAKELARRRYQAGAQAYQQGRYKDAIDLFLDADRIATSPAFAYNIGLAYEQLGDAPNALRWYRAYLRDLADAPDRADIERRIVRAEGRLRERGVMQVTVITVPIGAALAIDGERLGVTPWTGELVAGRHRATLELRGYRDADSTFEIPSDHAIDVKVELSAAEKGAPVRAAPPEPLPPDPTPPPPEEDHQDSFLGKIGPFTWASAGVGVAGLGAALGFEVARSGAVDGARHAPTNLEGKSRYESATTYRTAGLVAVGVGAAFTVASGVLLYLDLSRPGEAASTVAGLGCRRGACGVVVDGAF